jgi:general secretion pathway protein D
VELVPIIHSLIPPISYFSAHMSSSTLVVTDTASNIEQMLEIINRIDAEDQRTGIHVIYLKHADATDLVTILGEVTRSAVGEGADEVSV